MFLFTFGNFYGFPTLPQKKSLRVSFWKLLWFFDPPAKKSLRVSFWKLAVF